MSALYLNEFPFKARTNSDYSLIFKLEMFSLLIFMSCFAKLSTNKEGFFQELLLKKTHLLSAYFLGFD